MTGTVDTYFGKFKLDHSFPAVGEADKIYDLIDHQRAAQLYLWALPPTGMIRGYRRRRPFILENYMKKRQTKFLRMVLFILFLTASSSMVCAADDFQALVGRWQRTDGGYVIEIRSIGPDGKIETGYFNPRPINVEKAQASTDKDHIKLEMTLRDVGYPGSAYTLNYSPDKDVLFGYYYHPVSGQYFDVLFVRMK